VRSSFRVLVLVLLAFSGLIGPAATGPEARAEAPAGQVTWAVHISLAPVYFEPAEAPGIITPFMVYYALHDAPVKPMPGNTMAPSLAESPRRTGSSMSSCSARASASTTAIPSRPTT
jgi:peptide/nickel transport system substrate-binding protein